MMTALEDAAPIGAGPTTTGRPGDTSTTPVRLEDAAPLATPDTSEADRRSVAEQHRARTKDSGDFVGTSMIHAATGVAALPQVTGGIFGSAGEYVRGKVKEKFGEEGAKNYDQTPFGRFTSAMNETFAKHWPSPDEMKEHFWKDVRPHLGSWAPDRRDPDPNSPGEKLTDAAIQGGTATILTGGGAGATAIGAISSAAGEVAAELSESHPNIARFVGAITTALGLGAATKGGARVATALRPTVAPLTEGGRRDIAARGLLTASGETDPRVLAGQIAAGRDSPIPGYERTTSQAVGNNPNLTTAEKLSRTGGLTGPGQTLDLEQRTAQQGAAIRQHADAQAPAGDPQATTGFMERTQKSVRDAVDKIEQDAAAEVTRRVNALPMTDHLTSSKAGKIIREAAEEGHDNASKAVKTAFNEVLEPGRAGVIGVDPSPIIRRADYMMGKRYGRMNEPPALLTKLLTDIKEGGTLSYKDLEDLATRAGQLPGQLKDSNARGAALEMKRFILERMDASASETAKVLPYKAEVEMSSQQIIRERLVRLNELRDLNKQQPLSRWSASRDALESKIAEVEGQVKHRFDIQGELEPAEWARYLRAREMRNEVTQRYEQGAMGRVLGRGEEVGRHALADEAVPAQFWHARPGTKVADTNQFIETLGGHANAREELMNYGVGLLRAQVDRAGGTLTPQILNRFIRDHYQQLETYPSLMRDLGDITKVQQRLAADVGPARQTLEDYQRSAARHFTSPTGTPVDPDVAIKNILRPENRTGVADMREMVSLAGMDSSGMAMEGLRRGIMENATAAMRTAGRDVEGGVLLSSPKFREWWTANRDKIAPAMEPGHMRALEQINDELTRGHMGTGAGRSANVLANVISESLRSNSYVINVPIIGKYIQRLVEGRSDEVRRFFNEAMINPDAAQLLLQRITPSNAPTIQQRLTGAMMRAGVGVGVHSATHGTDEAP